MSPTQRTIAELKKRGYFPEVVEKWLPWAKRRKDLYGCLDVIAVGHGATLGVQCTSGSNMASRVAKIADSPAVPELRKSGWVLLVWGWRKNAKGKWVLREIDCS